MTLRDYRFMLDAVAPVGGQFRDAAPVPGRQWLRHLGDTLSDHAPLQLAVYGTASR